MIEAGIRKVNPEFEGKELEIVELHGQDLSAKDSVNKQMSHGALLEKAGVKTRLRALRNQRDPPRPWTLVEIQE